MKLRTIGLIGGITYHSTIDYYRLINEQVAAQLGGHTSAPLVMISLNFQEVRDRQMAEDWDKSGEIMAQHGRTLQAAGAEAVMICANLMHKVAPAVERAIDVPLIHIVDAVAAAAGDRNLSSLGVMGAKWTMRDEFYRLRLAENGIRAVQASDANIELTDQIVFDELTQGIILDSSRIKLLGVVDQLAQAGADGVVLGCTEIPLILSQKDSPIPLIDSMQAHVDAAVQFILGDSPRY